jgi:hypothetical protein
MSVTWREISLDRVNWRITASSRNAMVLFGHSVPPRDPKWPADHEWAGMTLGQLADLGERKWSRATNVGVKAVAAIKEMIDRAAVGEDVTVGVDGDDIGPYMLQPWPRKT